MVMCLLLCFKVAPLHWRGAVGLPTEGRDHVLCLFSPPVSEWALRALLWGAKAPVVASNALPRCPLREWRSSCLLFVLKLRHSIGGELSACRLRGGAAGAGVSLKHPTLYPIALSRLLQIANSSFSAPWTFLFSRVVKREIISIR